MEASGVGVAMTGETGDSVALLSTDKQVHGFVKQLREEVSSIVLTSGSFDVFHDGHLNYLDLAAKFGDALIVGVDNDTKVRARKGPGRPVVSEIERIRMVSYHPKVSAVVLKSINWPRWHLIDLVRPHVLVVSEGTYSSEDLDKLANKFGSVEVLKRTARLSTSSRLNMLADYGGLYSVASTDRRERISLDQMFLNIALIVSQRSTCSLLQVGAVLAHDGRTLSTGYNGAPSGESHCECATTGNRCPVSSHAELNAMVFAARNGTSIDGATLYLTHNPCFDCAGHIINAGVPRVVFDRVRARSSSRGVRRLRTAGIEVACQIAPDPPFVDVMSAR